MVVATHFHADHIAGLTVVLEQYRVKTLLMNKHSVKSDVFDSFKEAVSKQELQGLKVLYPIPGQILEVGKELNLVVIWPAMSVNVSKAQEMDEPEQTRSQSQLLDTHGGALTGEFSENDGSIVIFGEVGDVGLALVGDLEAEGELALINAGLLRTVDILKVGHHGSKTSTTHHFLSSLLPELSVISAGSRNKYNHPSEAVLNALTSIGSRVVRTDQQGEIVIVIDSNLFWYWSQK